MCSFLPFFSFFLFSFNYYTNISLQRKRDGRYYFLISVSSKAELRGDELTKTLCIEYNKIYAISASLFLLSLFLYTRIWCQINIKFKMQKTLECLVKFKTNNMLLHIFFH